MSEKIVVMELNEETAVGKKLAKEELMQVRLIKDMGWGPEEAAGFEIIPNGTIVEVPQSLAARYLMHRCAERIAPLEPEEDPLDLIRELSEENDELRDLLESKDEAIALAVKEQAKDQKELQRLMSANPSAPAGGAEPKKAGKK